MSHKVQNVSMWSRTVSTGEKELSPYQATLNWIYEQKAKVDQAKYGGNKKSVQDAIEEQKTKAKKFEDYQKEVNRVRGQMTSEEDKQHLQETYEGLLESSRKKLACLQTQLDITSLEEHCGTLSATVDAEAVQLVKPSGRGDILNAMDQNPGFIAPSAQDCIFATKDNWAWILRLAECIQIHLKNASAYHQFFHNMDETGQWMMEDLGRLHRSYDFHQLKGDYDDAVRLLKELEEIAQVLRQWETKTNFHWDEATKIVPVHLRTQSIKNPTPVRSLCDYETKEISIRNGEDLLLLDNSRANTWKVRNGRGQETNVPALACLIPGPFKEAIEAAVKMRLQLLAAWTTSLKKIGKRLIYFMLLVFKPAYAKDEIELMRSVKLKDKKELVRILDFVEDTLKVHWEDHEGFVNLQERLLSVRMILEEAADHPTRDENVYMALVVQLEMLEKLIQKYKELWRFWELYKVALETSRQPELMLIVDKWEQLKYVTREYFAKFWQTNLPLSEVEKKLTGIEEMSRLAIERIEDDKTDDDTDNLETITATKATTYESAGSGMYGNGKPNTTAYARTSLGSYENARFDETTGESAESNEYNHARSTTTTSETSGSGAYETAKSGVRPRLQEASNGRIRTVVESATIEESGLEEIEEQIVSTRVNQEFSQAKQTVEESDLGYATEHKTAKTEQLSSAEVEEKKTFVIRSVIDPRDNSEIALQQAIMLGIINPSKGMYMNPATNETMPIPVAMTQGLIKVEFTSTRRSKEKKSTLGIITVKTIRENIKPHQIKTVTDVKNDEKVDRQEAVQRGILETQNGIFKNSSTGQEMLIVDAVEKGFIEVEADGDMGEPEVQSKTYAVRAVVDKRRRKCISFSEAVNRGIIDKDSGAFLDTETNEKMYVGDAIMRGFLKARIVGDNEGLNIDPKNQMVIDKTNKIRSKIVKPLAVISAFKRAVGVLKK